MKRREILQGLGLFASIAVLPQMARANFTVRKEIDWNAVPTFYNGMPMTAEPLTMLSQAIIQLQLQVQDLQNQLNQKGKK
jgi:hypothetical protein